MTRLKRYSDQDIQPLVGRAVAAKIGSSNRPQCGRLSLRAINGVICYAVGPVTFSTDAVLAVHGSQVLPIVVLS